MNITPVLVCAARDVWSALAATVIIIKIIIGSTFVQLHTKAGVGVQVPDLVLQAFMWEFSTDAVVAVVVWRIDIANVGLRSGNVLKSTAIKELAVTASRIRMVSPTRLVFVISTNSVNFSKGFSNFKGLRLCSKGNCKRDSLVGSSHC